MASFIEKTYLKSIKNFLKHKVMMDWKNTAENLGLILVGIVFGAILGHRITKTTSESLIVELKPTIEKAIDKETISNTISNAIDLKIDKIKKTDTLEININQEPFNDQKPTNNFTKNENCYVTQKQYESLSDGEKRRLNRWLNK